MRLLPILNKYVTSFLYKNSAKQIIQQMAMAEREKKQLQGDGQRRRSRVVMVEKEKFEATEYKDLTVKGLLVIYLLIVLLVNLDFGILTTSSVEIKASLGLDNLRFGALQSMVFLGTIIGQVIMPEVTSRLFDKVMVTFCLIGVISTLLPMCILSFSFFILLLSRFVFGIAQIILISYISAWIDSKTIPYYGFLDFMRRIIE